MGRGLGPAQRDLLRLLDSGGPCTVSDLAAHLHLSARRTRALVSSLRTRQLVWLTRTAVGWKERAEPIPVSHPARALARAGHPVEYPEPTWHDERMPVCGLLVWTPRQRLHHLVEGQKVRAAYGLGLTKEWAAEVLALHPLVPDYFNLNPAADDATAPG